MPVGDAGIERAGPAGQRLAESTTYGDLTGEAELRVRDCGCGQRTDRHFVPGHESRVLQQRVRARRWPYFGVLGMEDYSGAPRTRSRPSYRRSGQVRQPRTQMPTARTARCRPAARRRWTMDVGPLRSCPKRLLVVHDRVSLLSFEERITEYADRDGCSPLLCRYQHAAHPAELVGCQLLAAAGVRGSANSPSRAPRMNASLSPAVKCRTTPDSTA